MFNADTSTTSTAGSTSANSQLADETVQTVYPFRLLRDEVVLGTFPVAQKTRPLGRLVSFLFVTDSRVIYSAESKTILASSIHMKEYQVSTIKGIEIGRHRGFDALSTAAAIGVILNFIGWLILTAVVTSLGSSNNIYGSGASYDPIGGAIGGFGLFFVFLAAATLIIGGAGVFILHRPRAELSVVGPEVTRSLAAERDLARILLTIILFLIFGLFAGFAIISWTILRELGMFSAEDAKSFADTHNIDHISYEVGALILDVQARGKLAGK